MKVSGRVLRNLIVVVALLSANAALAQSRGIQFKGSFDAVVDCDQPLIVRDFKIHGEAAGVINPDRTGSADLEITALFPERMHLDGRLGHWTTVPGGTGRMQITGHNRLRLIWNLPNNLLITDIAILRESCRANLTSQLKRGKTQYSLFHGNSYYYCSKPRVVATTCQVN